MDRVHSYLEFMRGDLLQGKLIRYYDRRFNHYRFFWLDVRTHIIFELPSHYLACYRHFWFRFSSMTSYSLKAGHVVDNWNYELPF